MKEIKHFLLPEHTNTLYENEALSSISLTKEVASKINEIVDVLNEFSNDDIEWKQLLEGKINSSVVFMKDNLINSLNDLMQIVGDRIIDKSVEKHITSLKEQLNNLLGLVVQGTTSMDSEIIDSRVSYNGVIYKTLGAHLRDVCETLKEIIDNIEIEYYEKIDLYVDIKNKGVKYENQFFRIPDSDFKTADNWCAYVFDVVPKEKYHIKSYTVSAGRCVAFISEELTSSNRNPAFGYIPINSSNGEIIEFTVEVPENAIKMVVNENIKECDAIIGKCYGNKYVKTSDNLDRLYGKKLICCGDSITEAVNPNGGYFKNYAEIVAENHGMVCVKDGVGGSTISNIGNGKSFTENRYLKHTDFDYLTIWFGWNDNAYSSIGNISDTTDKTFYGAYNKVLTHYIKNYPTKKIGLIVPYCVNTKIHEAVRNLSKKFGVPCLDLPDSTKCSLIWDLKSDTGKARTNALTYDTTHPNQDGYNFIATMYEAFLLTL